MEATMKFAQCSAAFAMFLALLPAPAQEPVKAPGIDYTELSRLIQKIAAAQAPKVIEDNSGWTGSVPLSTNLKLPRLKREMIKVGDRLELPHGIWHKEKVWLLEPEKTLAIRVRDLKPLDAKTYRLALDADVALHGQVEVQTWQKGLALVGFIAEADAFIGLNLEFEIGITLETKKFPPEIKVVPKVSELKTDLKDFALRQVTLRRLGTILEGETAREAGNQVKGYLQEAMRRYEPEFKERANETIARSLREGKGGFSADALFKALSK
jgi:hypothetical protein